MDVLEAVELQGDLVSLTPLEIRHAEGLAVAAEDKRVFEWLPYAGLDEVDRARSWIAEALTDREAGRRLAFAVLDGASGAVIGSTSYWDYDTAARHVEIGSSWLASPCWRTGRNLEAKRLLLGHAFETLGLERVEFQTDSMNKRSRAAIEGLGAVAEGVFRHERMRRDGTWRDSARYSILREEWPQCRVAIDNRLKGASG
jgi:RimJ/RimL family protein N-acetyltransferase